RPRPPLSGWAPGSPACGVAPSSTGTRVRLRFIGSSPWSGVSFGPFSSSPGARL
ncbi:hypothetical protein DIPPA_11932, partial [Diplonema papillatum]